MTTARSEPICGGGEAAPEAGPGWPGWKKALISLGLLFHIAAILVAALAAQPSSPLERRAAAIFAPYYHLINQGYGYRYYARLDTTTDPRDPRPWATPVVTLEMEFPGPGRAPAFEVVRLPDRRPSWPRLRFQRQLDLAYHLTADPRWAASYARHLCRTRGCARVAVYTQEHRIPDLARVRAAAAEAGAAALDFEAESTYSPRVLLGEFRCTDF